MPQLSNLKSTRYLNIFGRLGSFWNSTFGDKERARKLVALSNQSHLVDLMEATMQNLAGDTAPAPVRNQMVTFEPSQVQPAGDILFDKFPEAYGTGFSYPDEYDGGATRYWILPVGRIIPFCIQSSFRKLLVGIDFFILKDEFIMFRHDPRLIFDGSSYLVVSGRTTRQSYFEYAASVKVKGDIKPVIDYCRNYQTPHHLLLALCAIAGLKTLSATQRLLHVNTNGVDVVYTFERESIRVEYEHDLLTVNQVYPKDYVIGEGIKILSRNGKDNDWWREVDWKGGISLDPLISFKGLRLLNRDVHAYVAGADADGNLHVRMPLSDDFYRERTYWDEVAIKETSQGFFLNTVAGLTQHAGTETEFTDLMARYDAINAANALENLPPVIPNTNVLANKKMLNPLDTFFRAVFNTRVMVILIKQSMIGNQQEFFKFLARELPIGCLPLILAYGPDLLVEKFSLVNGGAQAIVRNNLSLVTGDESTYSLNAVGIDFVRIKHETLD